MKPSIIFPSSAPICRSDWLVTMFWKMTNITVAITLPAVVNRSTRKVNIDRGMLRRKMRRFCWCLLGWADGPRGAMNMLRKLTIVPTMKQANIQRLAMPG